MPSPWIAHYNKGQPFSLPTVRTWALGEDRLLGDGREASPANLLPVPTGKTTVRSYGGKSGWCMQCAFLTMVTF